MDITSFQVNHDPRAAEYQGTQPCPPYLDTTIQVNKAHLEITILMPTFIKL